MAELENINSVGLKYAYHKDKPIRRIENSDERISDYLRIGKEVSLYYDMKPITARKLHLENVQLLIQSSREISRLQMIEYYNCLCGVLLDIGGKDVILPDLEEDIKNITDYGQLWYSKRIDMCKMRKHRCHHNSCDLWKNEKDRLDIKIATGYALTKGGYWIQHSWLVNKKARSVRVIETTERMLAYYGYVMTEEQCYDFCSYH